MWKSHAHFGKNTHEDTEIEFKFEYLVTFAERWKKKYHFQDGIGQAETN